MKKPSTKEQQKREDEITAACERTRQACNNLNREERQRLLEEGLRIIYGRDAKATTRSR